jgi:hypothetical protein
MAGSKEKKPKKVRIPAVYFWAAGHKAKAQGIQQDLDLVRAVFRNSVGDRPHTSYFQAERELSFSRKAKPELYQGVIPFVRDELDLSLAVFLFGQGAEFILRSDQSCVGSGFLRASQKEVAYVDLVSDMIRADSFFGEFLSQSDKGDLLHILDDFTAELAFYQCATDDDQMLKITGKAGAFSTFKANISCNISIWNSLQSGPAGNSLEGINRNLGQAKLHRKGSELYLQDLSAQAKLELTAASVVGQWLLIESQQFKSFGPLPDLTAEDDQRVARVDPLPLTTRFTLGEVPFVYSGADVARHFSKMYPWFVPEDAKIWLEAIHQ